MAKETEKMAKESYELTAKARMKGNVLVTMPDGRKVDLVGTKPTKYKRLATKKKPESEDVYEIAKPGDIELFYKTYGKNQKIVKKIGRETPSNGGLIEG